MAVKILANRFNNLQARIAAAYGNPANDNSLTGYAQPVRSSQVDGTNLVSLDFNASDTTLGGNVDTVNNRIIFTSNHNLSDSDIILYEDNGNLPVLSSLRDENHYYVKIINSTTIEIYDNPELINPLSLNAGSTGTHSILTYNGDVITHVDYFSLYLDIAAARIHQIGSSFTIGNNVIIQTGIDKVQEDYISNLERIMTDVESNRFAIADPGQVSLEPLKDGTGSEISSGRTRSWNGTIRHEFLVDFGSSQSARGFFNAQGEIRIDPGLSGQSGPKSNDWSNILSQIGSINYNLNGTNPTGSDPGSIVNIPFESLTTSYQTVVQKQGASYANNRFRLRVKKDTSGRVYFESRFEDLDNPAGFGIDENVNGTISNTVNVYLPTGTFTVGGETYNTVSFSPIGQLLSSL